jgi:hypothetical protein
VDRQRRRADNNDKAYKITQRELDAARDRVKLLEEALRRAGFAAASAALAAAPAQAPVKAAPAVAPAEEAPTAPAEAAAVVAAVAPLAAPAEAAVDAPAQEAGLGDDLSSVDDAWSELSLDDEL